MSTVAPLETKVAVPASSSSLGPNRYRTLLQRKCACGSATASLTGECPECKRKKLIQTKLAVGASNNPLEQEADRIADAVLSSTINPVVSNTPPRIQRQVGISEHEQADSAPASVDRVLSGSGSALDPKLMLDMEQRFGHDFSQVRIHIGGSAEQSTRDVNARAYTVGNNIVFGTNQFSPETPAGRHLIAHELTHVVQQSGQSRISSGIVENSNFPAIHRSPVQVSRLAGPPIPVTPEEVELLRQLFRLVTTAMESGAIPAEEAAAISSSVLEAEAAILSAGELAAAGTTALAAGETALTGAAALAVDDVTGIGVADDVAIPFILLAAAVAFGVGYAIGSSATEITAAWSAARTAMERALQVMREALRRMPKPIPKPVNESPPKKKTDKKPEEKPKTELKPRPKPLSDTDTEDDPGPCRSMPVGQRGGNTCHDAFATQVSGSPREWGVETPEGLYRDFDALGAGRMLFEIKTGYGYLLNTSPQTAQMRERTILQFIDQASAQQLIADRCGYGLVWVFNNRAVADLVQGFVEPLVTYRPFDCDEDL